MYEVKDFRVIDDEIHDEKFRVNVRLNFFSDAAKSSFSGSALNKPVEFGT